MPEDPVKNRMQAFWGKLYESLYEDVDSRLNKDLLMELLEELEDMFRLRGHMAVEDMSLRDLKGTKILEIGSGAGGHSSLFSKYGAEVVSTDITFTRTKSTKLKLDLLAESSKSTRVVQADAETLPFKSSEFDIVYSNGVLHHTLNTERAISEVSRVLKPDGKAVIMLYCKSSWHYWFNMVFCVGLLQGKVFSDTTNWLGHATEWGGKNKQQVLNPITKCYSASGIKRLFSEFEILNLRKREFYFYLIPKIGKIYRRWQIKRYGTHPGGLLVYGEPWPIQSQLELWLGRFIGWSWFIVASPKKK